MICLININFAVAILYNGVPLVHKVCEAACLQDRLRLASGAVGSAAPHYR